MIYDYRLMSDSKNDSVKSACWYSTEFVCQECRDAGRSNDVRRLDAWTSVTAKNALFIDVQGPWLHVELCTTLTLCIFSLSSCRAHFDSFRWPLERYFSRVAMFWCSDACYITLPMENVQFSNDWQTMKTISVNWKTWFMTVELVIRRLIWFAVVDIFLEFEGKNIKVRRLWMKSFRYEVVNDTRS